MRGQINAGRGFVGGVGRLPAVICRRLGVSRSGVCDWRSRGPSASPSADRALMRTITEIHTTSLLLRSAASARRARLGLGMRCRRSRVARLMRLDGFVEICHRRKRRGEGAALAALDGLLCRRFVADRLNMLWINDITQHPTRDGTVYCRAALKTSMHLAGVWSPVVSSGSAGVDGPGMRCSPSRYGVGASRTPASPLRPVAPVFA